MKNPVFFWMLAGLLALPLAAWAQNPEETHGPDSHEQPGVPRGKIEQIRWKSEKIFPGTERDLWIYVPAQYRAGERACLMIFNDGGNYLKADGPFRASVVLDNLIHAGDMPVTIGVFLNPGVIPATVEGGKPRANRSFEYDSLGDQYARFLLEEILPFVAAKHGISDDPRHRALCGISSGGIAAFTAAWERPDQFGKVLSHVGSFVNIRGGHVYPAMIRKTANKPLRIFLQDGSGDLDNVHGSWPLANQEMAAALAFKKYDFKFVFGSGGHNGKHGGAILPDSLRWLWRDWKETP